MTINKAIITSAEADAILDMETDWLVLTDEVKEYNIALASVYMQLNWTCATVDWSDDETFTAEIKEACAYYSLASANGNLYPDAKSASVALGLLKEETSKLGTLVDTIKYYDGKSTVVDPLTYPNALMSYPCEYSGGGYAGSRQLTRV